MVNKKYYLIYQVTNNVNGKIYIGKHETDNLEDDYMGSGKILNRAKEKYGIENFTFKVLIYLNNEEEMNLLEHLVVTPEFCQRDDVYNLNEGGDGGWNYVNSKLTTEFRKNITTKGGKNVQNKYRSEYGSFTKFLRQTKSKDKQQEWINNFKKSIKEFYNNHPGYLAGENSPMFGYEWSDKQRKHLSEIKKGKRNNRYGSKWYYDPITFESHSFLPNEKIPNGWIRGRKIKKR